MPATTLRLPEPHILRPAEIGLSISQQEITRLGAWIARNSVHQRAPHIHSTSRDSRDHSWLRKTKPLLVPSEFTPPEDVAGLVRDLYDALHEPMQQFIRAPLEKITTRYAASGHTHLPGDDAAEGHLDYYPSANFYTGRTNRGGKLLVAQTASPRSVEQIREEAYDVTPQPNELPPFFLIFR